MAEARSAAPPGTAFALARALRAAAIGFGTGVLVGGLVGGVGGRVVMRILFLENEATSGAITENGNRVGVMTSGGTLGLVLGVALFLGGPAGLAYVLVRRWLPGPSVVRGLLFGAFLLVVFEGGAIDPDNVDFRIFTPAGLGVALFGLLPFAFGVSLSALVDRWDSYVPRLVRRTVPTVAGYAVLGAVTAVKTVDFARAISELV